MEKIEEALNCSDLIVRCMRSLDARQYDEVAACFAQNGIWERGGQKLEGPQAVRAALDKRPADLQTQHLVSNMTLDEETDGLVTAEYSVAAYAQRGHAPFELHAIFRAKDRLIKEPAGWRFILRTVTPAFAVHG